MQLVFVLSALVAAAFAAPQQNLGRPQFTQIGNDNVGLLDGTVGGGFGGGFASGLGLPTNSGLGLPTNSGLGFPTNSGLGFPTNSGLGNDRLDSIRPQGSFIYTDPSGLPTNMNYASNIHGGFINESDEDEDDDE